MALPYLHKAKNIKKKSDNLVLDYKNIDPAYQQFVTAGEKKASEIVEEAKKDAEQIVERARHTARDIETTVDKYVKQQKLRAEEKEKESIETLKSLREKLEKEFKEKTEHEEKRISDREHALEAERERQRATMKEELRGQLYEEIKEKALSDSVEECDRLVGRVQAILDEAIRHRTAIFSQMEEYITELVLLIAKKSVKAIAETEKSVVIKNVTEALHMVKGREHFIIRLNTRDMGEVKKYFPHIQKKLELRGNITFAEDSSVDPGGCVIETEFGEVDARISAHMQKIEQNIREAFPMRH